MDYKYLNEQGSFKAWGIGFQFEYDAEFGILDIIHARSARPILYLDIDQSFGQDALQYARILDKSLQVSALSLSNNIGIDLTEILDHDKLSPILQSVAQKAQYCFNLDQKKYKEFSRDYNQDLECAHVKVRHIQSTLYSSPFYTAHFQTNRGGVATIRDAALYTALGKLSEIIVQDLVMKQSLASSDYTLQRLLNAASDLFAMSCILNPSFKPYQLTAASQAVAANKLHGTQGDL